MSRIECTCGDGPCQAITFFNELREKRDEMAVVRTKNNYVAGGECLRTNELNSYLENPPQLQPTGKQE